MVDDLKLIGLLDYEPGRMAGMIPRHLREGLKRWIEDGTRPGDALWSIICDHKLTSVLRMDEQTFAGLPDIIRYLHNYAPGKCHGSEELASLWINQGGLRGYAEKRGITR